MLGTEAATELDRIDPVPVGAFELPEGVVYLDGNSLGAMPSHVPGVAREVVETQWGTGLIRSWNDADWVSLPERVGDRIGRIIDARSRAAQSRSLAGGGVDGELQRG